MRKLKNVYLWIYNPNASAYDKLKELCLLRLDAFSVMTNESKESVAKDQSEASKNTTLQCTGKFLTLAVVDG